MIFPLLHGIVSQRGASTIFTDGYGGDVDSADDTTFRVWTDGSYNGGAHASFAPRGGVERCLLRFDLSSIPASATCISATLSFFHDQGAEAAPNPATGTINSVSLANSDWVAGNKDIAAASLGETCWNAKASDGAGGVSAAWAGSVGCGTSGVDFEATAMGSYSVDPGAAIGVETAITLDATRVHGWFGASNTNYGIIIFATNTSEIHWGQSDNVTPAYRPKLVVEYT